jgi:hypothetical protein
MSTQIKAEPMNRERPSAHQVLLAGLGAVSLLRKNAGKTWAETAAIVGRLPEASSIMVEGIGERSAAMIEELGARGNAFRWEFARIARVLGKEASTATIKVVADVESRLQPLLVKVGVVKPQPKRTTAKRTRKTVKPVAKRTTRKPRKVA